MSLSVSAPEVLKGSLDVPEKILMGPGPSNVSQRVLNATAKPVLGHLHPEFCKIMDDTKAGIQYAFQTSNPMTLALSATGHAGMECVMTNMLEKGDVILIAKNGIWGQRAGDMANRQGATVKFVEKSGGVPFTLDDIGSALAQHKPKLFFITHGESSTGCVQGLEGIGPLCHSHNCLLAVDTVASLGGVPVQMDKLEIDIMYTGSQKVLGVPPGLAPISFNQEAVSRILSRKTPSTSFYLDIDWLGQYWACFPDKPRVYHHTGPVNSIYGLREGLAMLAEEGLDNCWKRHRLCADKLHEGIKSLGLEFYVSDPSARLPTVTTIKVPDGIDWKAVTVYIMKKYQIEISGGLGPSAGQVWRIGVMGENAKIDRVDRVIKALGEALEAAKQGKL